MGYYYDPAGNKIPVDGHSPPEAQQAAYAQQQKDAAAKTFNMGDLANLYQGAKDTAGGLYNQAQANFNNPGSVDNHYNYAGTPGGANEAANRYRYGAESSQGRQSAVINYAGANDAYNQGQLSRQNQGDMAGLMAARARGQVPSISQMQADRQMGQAAAEQSSAAASARGPAGLALAQQGAAANTANMQANISQQAQINAANERLQAEQAAFGAYGGMRAGDAQSQAQMAQQAQAQASLQQQQHGLNDQMQLGMTGYETGVRSTQLGAQGNQIAAANGLAQSQAQLAQNAQFQAQNRTDKYIGYGLGALGTGLGVAGMILSPPGNNSAASGRPDAPVDQYGSAGATGGGYDAVTGAPVAGTGGGYDPDDPRRKSQ